MNCCLCLILIKSCLVLSSDMRAVPGHPAGGETVKPPVNTELITTKSKHLISASTGVPPSVPPAGARFHAASFVGGMTLAFILILAFTLGYRLACSQREVRYRAIEEHDAII